MQTVLEPSRSLPKYFIREVRGADTNRVCSWVTTKEQLQMVSGDLATCLTPVILGKWVTSAVTTLVVCERATGTPVGFCTLTLSEISNPPNGHIELCHLIIDPKFRHDFVGPRIIAEARHKARSLGFEFLFGRVIPSNEWCLALVRRVRGEEFTDRLAWTPTGFRWFRLKLR